MHDTDNIIKSYEAPSEPVNAPVYAVTTGQGWETKIAELALGHRPRDCMIDLETVDNSVTSAIASIGACIFDANGVYHTFYCVVDHKTAIDIGMTWSQDTLDWWAKQGEQARKIFDPSIPKLDIREALIRFASWFKEVGAKELWGNGADFDNAIMSYAYRRADMKQPWNFSASRCFRTIKNGAYIQARAGVYHNALDDAITQAQYMVDKKLMPVR